MGFSRHLGFLKGFMSFTHRIYTALLCMAFALITACNPAPLSVVASDFSINGVKGTGAMAYSTATTASGTTTTATTATTAASATPATTTTTKATNATTPTTATANSAATNSVQNVTIDLTKTETCSTLTSLVAKVELDAGVTISPNPSVARDYSSPVTFVVTDAYGTKVSYLLTVKSTPCVTTAKVTTSDTPTCTIASTGSTGYSLVFKACDANNVATYYDKTECVRDNATSLIWEGKTSAGLRGADIKYNNLDSTSLLQIAANTVPSTTPLPARSPTQAEIDASDNTIGYKNNVNALSLCGSSRWRLPTLTELQTIRLPGATTQIDLEWFANTNFNGYYATSTQFGTQVERSSVIQFYEKGAATVDNLLRDGTVWDPTLGAVASPAHSVRLVRSLF